MVGQHGQACTSTVRRVAGHVGISLVTGVVFLVTTAIIPAVFNLEPGNPTWQKETLASHMLLPGISFAWGAGAGLLLSFGMSLIRSRLSKTDRTVGRLFVAAVALSWLSACLGPSICFVIGIGMAGN